MLPPPYFKTLLVASLLLALSACSSVPGSAALPSYGETDEAGSLREAQANLTTPKRKRVFGKVTGFLILGDPIPAAPEQPIEIGYEPTAETIAYINKRYGHIPELREAAMFWAATQEARLAEETLTGGFNKATALRTAHALICLSAMGDRLGQPTSGEDITNFVATFATTPDRVRALARSNKLASGHPLRLYMSEERACRAAKGP
jgi:hypothetical protein